MESFHSYIPEYRKQLAKGEIKKAYQGLMGYIEEVRLHLKNKHPEYFLSGSLNQGQMDYTYFYFFPKTLKRQKLKIAILFIHDTFTFQALLAGYNKAVQAKYWLLFKENGWKKHPMAPTATGDEYLTDCVLADNPDFTNLGTLTTQIENGTLRFIKDIEDFMSELK